MQPDYFAIAREQAGIVAYFAIAREQAGIVAFGLTMTEFGGGCSRFVWHPTSLAMTPYGHLHVAATSFALDVAASFAVASTFGPGDAGPQPQTSSQVLRAATLQEHVVRGEVGSGCDGTAHAQGGSTRRPEARRAPHLGATVHPTTTCRSLSHN